ncbi:MAG: methyltransferase domain-containing protein [Betaproteobacteria bacterium]|nr:methyltransferase domain-containing protein [Betaproteobacteria bacterium]NBP44871.1 methyltransferase domain-containing protein [Betaproteobacteria bacterium]
MQSSGQLWQTPAGKYLLKWMQTQADSAVGDVFGYHALQLGFPALDALRNSRIQHRWFAHTEASPMEEQPAMTFATPLDAVLWLDTTAMPLANQSLDLVILPHTLEQSHDPHATLREVERTLVPEGKVVITGLNPWSLWGWRQKRSTLMHRLGMGQTFLPGHMNWMSAGRVKDWLQLLGFEIHTSQFGCYRPAMASQPWLDRWSWMESAGDRWWPYFGAAYCMVAVKRVRGMRLVKPLWRRSSLKGRRAVPSANANATGAIPDLQQPKTHQPRQVS